MNIKKKVVSSLVALLTLTTLIGCNNNCICSSSYISSNIESQIDDNASLQEHFSYFVYNSAAKMLGLNSETSANLTMLPVVYPFNTVEIINPFAFTIKTPNDFPQITSITNEETVLVIVCDLEFDTISHQESMIIFVGELGIFSCLTNGWGLDHTDYNRETFEFSQHKQLTKDGVLKYEPNPNLIIEVQLYSNELEEVRFAQHDKMDEMITGEIIEDSFHLKEASEVFTTINSVEYASASFIVLVQEIHENYLLVKNDEGYNLEYLYFDDNTEFIKDGVTVTLTEIVFGSKLIVSFYLYYESFNPYELTFKKVEIINEVNEPITK